VLWHKPLKVVSNDVKRKEKILALWGLCVLSWWVDLMTG
jgi:hypothetical protein